MARKRRKSEAFSLFAFQDIITAVTGIVVLITLLLAIELLERNDASAAEQTEASNAETQETNSELQTRIDELDEQLRKGLESVNDLPTTSEAVMRTMLEELEKELELIDGELKDNTRTMRKRQRERKNQKKKYEDVAARDEQEVRQMEEDADKLEEKIKKINNGRRPLFKKGNDNKTTWLVVVSRTGFKVGQVGVSKKPDEYSTVSSFVSWSTGLNKNANNIYMFVKPSGLENFNDSISKVKSSGIDVGFRCAGLGDDILDDETGAGL